MGYYTPLIIAVWVALLVLCILVFENNRLSKIEKNVLYFTYIMVAVAALAEWLGVQFRGNMSIPPWVLKMIKFFDYIFTPACGGIVILQFRRNGIIQKIIFGALATNLLFQTICVFTDWMVVVDASTMNYTHGILYPAYIGIYAIVLILDIIEFGMYGRRYRKRNQVSLYGILIFVVTTIALQEIFDAKIAYMGITLALALLFIHHNEFAQLEADDTIQEQMIQITIDPLTGILNRFAYEEALREADLSEDFVVFSIDINGLKNTNDTLGHKAGDELIKGAANVISETFKDIGKVYRIGGDEFMVLTHVEQKRINRYLQNLDKRVTEWHGREVPHMSLSTGYATMKEFDTTDVDDLIYAADQKMYKVKADYYAATGLDRRRH